MVIGGVLVAYKSNVVITLNITSPHHHNVGAQNVIFYNVIAFQDSTFRAKAHGIYYNTHAPGLWRYKHIVWDHAMSVARFNQIRLFSDFNKGKCQDMLSSLCNHQLFSKKSMLSIFSSLFLVLKQY